MSSGQAHAACTEDTTCLEQNPTGNSKVHRIPQTHVWHKEHSNGALSAAAVPLPQRPTNITPQSDECQRCWLGCYSLLDACDTACRTKHTTKHQQVQGYKKRAKMTIGDPTTLHIWSTWGHTFTAINGMENGPSHRHQMTRHSLDNCRRLPYAIASGRIASLTDAP